MPLSPEETKEKSKLIELVASLSVRPVTRPFGGDFAQTMRTKGVAFVKAEILKPEVIALLGDEYLAVKTNVEALQP